MRLLNERVEQSTPAQMVGWASSGQERAFTLRVDEIASELGSFELAARRQAESASVRAVRKGIARVDQQRIGKAVETYFDSLERIGLSLDEEWGDLPAEPGDVGLPQEQRLIAGLLLVGEGAFDGVSMKLTEEVTSVDEMRYVEALLADHMMRRGSPAMLDSLLVVAFAAFEDLFVSLIRLAVLAKGPQAKPKQDGFDETRAIVREAGKALRGGPTKWRPAVLQLAGFDPGDLIPDWDAIVEICLRRNTVVHHGGRVDERYLSGLGESTARPQTGEQLITTPDYLRATLNTLLAVGAGMATLWPNVLFPDEQSTLNRPVELVVRLLKSEGWGEAERVANTFQTFTDDEEALAPLQVNEWMARRERTGSLEVIADQVASWQPPSDEPVWAIAVAALLGDAQHVCALIENEQQLGRPTADYASWPLIRRLADSDAGLRSLVYRPQPRRRSR